MDEYSSQKRNEKRGRKRHVITLATTMEWLKKHKRKTVKSTGNCLTLLRCSMRHECEGRNVNNAPVTEIIGIVRYEACDW